MTDRRYHPPAMRALRALVFATAITPVSVLLSACGGTAPPAATAPSPAAEPAAPSGAPSGAPSAPAPSPGGGADAPTAKVMGVAVSDKADHFTRVTVSFENKTGRSCSLASYVLSWDGGSKEFPLESFVLGPGESKTRAARVHAGEGDITRLTGPEVAHVELKATCK